MDYQTALGERLNKQAVPLPLVVLASDSHAFNLGGDLRLFYELIRQKDREKLLDYAYRCVHAAYTFHVGLNAHSIVLVQGNVPRGGFESALYCHTIVAEEGVMMCFPEVLFDLFADIGAYSFMRKRISSKLAERIMLEGNLYKAGTVGDESGRQGSTTRQRDRSR